ncbi:MAG: ECF transporter S component [Oscillospiraceae bacterium]|nr:ECF transporter S component [Oscillospiraceae bacterium]MBR4092544.1 ECF transporter S component [Oscillospiraceae bacterium]MBR6647536.1 ECF transporter S component [Clostridia bacterium]
MNSFFSMFKRSAESLKELRTITTTGILLAMAVAIRSLAIHITPDLRIIFTFVPLCVIAMLYGPVVSGMSAVALDIIGYIIDNRGARGYSPQLAAVVLLTGVIYGCFLYRDKISLVMIILARGIAVILCNICLNSYFLYSLYINKDFSIFTADKGAWDMFMTWLWTSFRLPKNLAELPLDFIILIVVLPAALTAYNRVTKNTKKKIAINKKSEDLL